MTAVLPGFCEEFVHRGLLFNGYKDSKGNYKPGYIDMIRELEDKFPLSEPRITGEQNQKDFIALFRDAYTVGVLKDPQAKFASLKRLKQWSLSIADSKVGREKQKHFLQYAQQQVRENYIRNFAQPSLNYQLPAEREFSTRFAPFIHDGNVEQIMKQLELAERQIEQNGNAKVIFFDLCLQMIVLIKKPRN